MIETRNITIAALGAILIQVVSVRWASRILLGEVNPVTYDPASAPLAMVVVLLFVPPIAGLLWIWLFTVFGERDGWSRLGFQPLARPAFIRAAAIGLLSLLLVQVVVSMTPDSMGEPRPPYLSFDMEVADPVVIYRLAYALGAAGLAPVFEEVLFRGLLFSWMRRRFAFLGSAVIAALPHAAMHGDLAAMPALTVIFVLFAWIYEREGSLWASITAHATYNTAVLLLLLA